MWYSWSIRVMDLDVIDRYPTVDEAATQGQETKIRSDTLSAWESRRNMG